jgi:hypothetical protein
MGMAKLKFLSENEVHQMVEPILKNGLAPFGYQHVNVEEAEDFDGKYVFRLDAKVDTRVPADVLIGLMGKIHSQLRAVGESRFAILSTVTGGTSVSDDEEED